MLRKFCLLFLLVFLEVFSLKAQETLLFIGSYNIDRNLPGIYVYRLDNRTGKLSKLTEYSGVLNPELNNVVA